MTKALCSVQVVCVCVAFRVNAAVFALAAPVSKLYVNFIVLQRLQKFSPMKPKIHRFRSVSSLCQLPTMLTCFLFHYKSSRNQICLVIITFH